jgi:hypothetical protein
MVCNVVITVLLRIYVKHVLLYAGGYWGTPIGCRPIQALHTPTLLQVGDWVRLERWRDWILYVNSWLSMLNCGHVVLSLFSR